MYDLDLNKILKNIWNYVNFEKVDNYINSHIDKYTDYLPYDNRRMIFNKIVNKIDNIDYRRRWGVYNKINLEKYRILDTVMRNVNRSRVTLNGYTRYFFKNTIEFDDRKNLGVEDDMLDVKINIFNDSVKFKLCLFKLKRKNGLSRKENDNFYFKGGLSEYYWDDFIIEYTLF